MLYEYQDRSDYRPAEFEIHEAHNSEIAEKEMTEIKISITDLLVIIMAVAGLNWLIITLAIAPIKQSLQAQKEQITVIFEKCKVFLTKQECRRNMETCKLIRDAENHVTDKNHNS